MPRTSHLVAVVLLGTLVAALPGVQAFAFSPDQTAMQTAMQHDHAAACHGHKRGTPSPSAVSYQCCVSGHHAAIPGAAFSAAPRLVQLSDVGESLALGATTSWPSTRFTILSDSPPGSAPLRI